MKRQIITLIILYIPIMLNAQILKERRVYYLDCSYSMELNGLWDIVRDNLKKAIDNVADETTELIIIPFAFDSQKNPVLSPISAEATTSGKAMIKDKIDNLPMNNRTMTYHYVPVEDFYNNRVADDRITYMFLLTDGQDEDRQNRALKELLPKWGSKYGNKNVFGFYVMLCNDAHNSQISQEIERQDHLWKVETADVNINLIRLRDNLIFNIRNENELVIMAEQGDLSKCSIDVLELLCEGSNYCVENIRVDNNRIIANIQALHELSNLPEETMMALCLRPILPTKANDFSCLTNNKLSIKCKNTKERTLRLRFE